ncbi:arachidonate 12-lipoxygenase, 12S-type-like, partial [Clarias magur]
VSEYKVWSSIPLGRVLLVRLEMKKSEILKSEDNWFCRYARVTPLGGERTQTFPCYRWLLENDKLEIRDGT